VIEKPILELLNITKDTELEIVTDASALSRNRFARKRRGTNAKLAK
jgi:hypothetical protein